jgi:hypothetical protein
MTEALQCHDGGNEFEGVAAPEAAEGISSPTQAGRSLQPRLKFPIRLNGGWRIAYDPLQWVLQRRKAAGWENRSYCVTQSALERCIREYCGPVDANAITKIHTLPEWHPDRTGGKPCL